MKYLLLTFKNMDLLTVPEAAKLLKMTRQCMYGYIARGLIKVVDLKKGTGHYKSLRIKKHDLEAFATYYIPYSYRPPFEITK